MWLVAVSLCALAGDPPTLRLDVLEGRVRAAHEGGIDALPSGSSDWAHGPAGYLECSALARMRMRWLGSASLELEGPHAFSWEPARGEGRGITLAFAGLGAARLEVREGPLRFELPSGWRGLCAKGTLVLRGGAEGRVEVELLAGAPLLLSPPSSTGGVRPPWTVLPGARVRLLGADPRPRVAAGKVRSPEGESASPGLPAPVAERPWSRFAWPWSGPSTEPARGWGRGW